MSSSESRGLYCAATDFGISDFIYSCVEYGYILDAADITNIINDFSTQIPSYEVRYEGAFVTFIIIKSER
jgi:hypothetical protein